ncbi:MAG: hypothetical protein ACHQ5A_11090 [Opitutales bacterium]
MPPYPNSGDPRHELPAELALALFAAAEWAARAAARRYQRHRRARHPRGRTLRPGDRTPIWNALLQQAAPYLRRRGSKAHLARLLGVPRQRLQDCLKARTATLDAERTLLLLCWTAAHQQNRELLA